MNIKRFLRVPVGALMAGALVVGVGSTAVADDTRESQWPLESFVAEELWQQSTGKGVTVAVLDIGFRPTHQDLRKNLLPGKKFGEVKEHPDPTRRDEDLRNHGTSMSGIIAGHGHGPGGSAGVKGVAPEAKILPIATALTDGELAEAIRYAVNSGADVINLSLGRRQALVVEQAINYAVKKDIVVVASVGNDAVSEIEYPAGYPGVIGVGAVDKYGKVWEGSHFNSSVDLLAPGVGIMTAGGEADDHYQFSDGTSNSTAYVSAIAALIREQHPDLTAGQVANRLVKTAGLPDEMKGKELPDNHYGYGFIRPRAALSDDIPAGPKEGPLPMPKAGEESGLKPSTGDGSTGSILEEWGPLAGGVILGVVAVGGICVWLVRRSQRRDRSVAAGGGPTGMSTYPTFPGNQPPPMQPGNQAPPMPPGNQPPPMPPGSGYHNQGGPGSHHG